MRANASEDAKHRLHEEWRFNYSPVCKVFEGIEMSDVVAFKLKPRAIICAGRQDVLNISKGILEDSVT
ncbi:hypothetical protein D3C84_1233090 [compost metagenome]